MTERAGSGYPKLDNHSFFMANIGNWIKAIRSMAVPSMKGSVKSVEQDKGGNFFYMSNFFSPSGCVRFDYDLSVDSDNPIFKVYVFPIQSKNLAQSQSALISKF